MSYTQGALQPLPIRLGNRPPVGSRVVPATLPWANYASAGTNYPSTTLNLLAQFNTGQFADVQAVYVDNSTCPYAFQLTCNETLFTIQTPPFSIGMYPLLVEANPQLTVSLPYAPSLITNLSPPWGTTKIYILNTYQIPFVSPGIAFAAQQYTVSATTNLNARIHLLPALSAGQHYALTSLLLTIDSVAYFGLSGPYTFGLADSSGQRLPFFVDRFWLPSTTANGIIYHAEVTFPAPLVIPADAVGVDAMLSPTYGITANSHLTYVITYDIVTIV